MKARLIFCWLAVVAVALIPLGWLGQAQADTVIPLVVGYSATYTTTWAGSPTTNPFTATLQITGTETVAGTEYWILQFGNWIGDNQTGPIMDIRATDNAIYIGSENPHALIGPVGTTWIDEGGRNCIIAAITTYAGFDNVYEMIQSYDLDQDHQAIEYWKPGVGFLGEYTYNYLGSNLSESRTLTNYATPLPPSLVLFGSALAGLIGFRRLRRG